jgi:hypothetical protein
MALDNKVMKFTTATCLTLGGIATAAILYLGLAGITGCNSGVKSVVGKEYTHMYINPPKICKTTPELKLEGRFAIPVLYCKDELNQQVACRPEDSGHAIDATCYVLENKNEE